jgi:hypothetical protein
MLGSTRRATVRSALLLALFLLVCEEEKVDFTPNQIFDSRAEPACALFCSFYVFLLRALFYAYYSKQIQSSFLTR